MFHGFNITFSYDIEVRVHCDAKVHTTLDQILCFGNNYQSKDTECFITQNQLTEKGKARFERR